MRRLSQKRLLRLASLVLTGLTVVFGILWVVRGLRPAIDCGVLDYLGRGDWLAAYACVDLTDYDGVLFALGLAGSLVFWLRSRKAPDTPLGEYHPTPVEQARNRKGMIDRVWAIWIEGHLDQTLYQAVLMSLGMTLRPAAPRPGSVRLRRAGEAERPVPEYVSTVQLFDQAGHALLILGEPGSGKTTMLLDLARSLLERAREDESTPIPVVFNLSSLTDPEQSLEDWLVGEFRSSYQVPEKVARYWLAHDELALVLDGLDEVRADRRAGVVAKLYQYRAQHMDPWLVVCCRQNEYAELVADEAAVEGVDAVALQPLTQAQIKGYLADLRGPEPQRLWRALQDDPVLMELADTPLMLNVMLLATEQLDWSALPSEQGREAVRSHIYDAYIRSMLARHRETGRDYPYEKILKWLRWLAAETVENDLAVPPLETKYLGWANRPWRWLAWHLMIWLIYALVFGSFFEPITGLIAGLIVSLGFAVIQTTSHARPSCRSNQNGLVCKLVWTVIVVLLIGLGIRVGWIWLEYFWPDGRSNMQWLLATPLMLIFLFSLTVTLYFVMNVIEERVRLILYGRRRKTRTSTTRHMPSYLDSQLSFTVHGVMREGLFVGLFSGLLFGFTFEFLVDLKIGLPIGLFIGLFVIMTYGVLMVTEHYTLRLVLLLDRSMPLNYVRFLDYCVDRVLLRRVGGGYMFIHRTMMEHTAGLDLEKWKEQPDSP